MAGSQPKDDESPEGLNKQNDACRVVSILLPGRGQREPQEGDLAVKGAQIFGDLLAGPIARSIQRQPRVPKRGRRIEEASFARDGVIKDSGRVAAPMQGHNQSARSAERFRIDSREVTLTCSDQNGLLGC